MDIFRPIREQLSNENTPEYNKATISLKGDDDAGAKTGEVQGPRVLGYEQILAGDFSADKFPAPGEWYLSVSVADSETQPAEARRVPAGPRDHGRGRGAAVVGELRVAARDAHPEPTEAPLQRPELLTASADAGDPTLTIALVGVLALLGGLGLGALAARVLPR